MPDGRRWADRLRPRRSGSRSCSWRCATSWRGRPLFELPACSGHRPLGEHGRARATRPAIWRACSRSSPAPTSSAWCSAIPDFVDVPPDAATELPARPEARRDPRGDGPPLRRRRAPGWYLGTTAPAPMAEAARRSRLPTATVQRLPARDGDEGQRPRHRGQRQHRVAMAEAAAQELVVDVARDRRTKNGSPRAVRRTIAQTVSTSGNARATIGTHGEHRPNPVLGERDADRGHDESEEHRARVAHVIDAGWRL